MQKLVCGSDQPTSRFDVLRVVRVLPLHKMLNELQAAVPGRILDRGAIIRSRLELSPSKKFSHQLAERLRAFGIVGVGNERGEHRRPARRKRFSSPPDVKGRDIPVADRLLPSGLLGDFFERQGDFDQPFQHRIGLFGLRGRWLVVVSGRGITSIPPRRAAGPSVWFHHPGTSRLHAMR